MATTRAARYCVVYAMLLAMAAVVHMHAVAPVRLAKPLSEFPRVVGRWTMQSDKRLDPATLGLLKPTDYVFRQYAGPHAEHVDLYVVYYDGGDRGANVHSPLVCFAGSGWMEKQSAAVSVPIGDVVLSARELVYEKDSQSEYILFWYQTEKCSVANELLLKLYLAKNSALDCRREQSLVRINVPITDGVEQARATAFQFLGDMLPYVAEYLGG